MILFDLSATQWIWVVTAAFFVGFSKMGIGGFMMLIIPILASIFGGRESTGILLPILLIGDVFAVVYYRRHAEKKDIIRLIPWALFGIIIGLIVGNYVNDSQFKMIIAISVLICVSILIYTEKKGSHFKVPEKMWFYALTGIASGFTTMIGNAAGPILSIYLLAMGYKKNDFIGTYAWFFLIVNFLKLPLQIFFWHNITTSNIMLAAYVIPAVALGAYLGVVIVKKINEKPFRYIIIGMTAFAALKLIF